MALSLLIVVRGAPMELRTNYQLVVARAGSPGVRWPRQVFSPGRHPTARCTGGSAIDPEGRVPRRRGED